MIFGQNLGKNGQPTTSGKQYPLIDFNGTDLKIHYIYIYSYDYMNLMNVNEYCLCVFILVRGVLLVLATRTERPPWPPWQRHSTTLIHDWQIALFGGLRSKTSYDARHV